MKKKVYRVAPTSRGLQKIENKTLEKYDPDFYANLNTGILEQYLEERVDIEGKIKLSSVVFALVIGLTFVLINTYMGLKVGIIIGCSSYLVGLAGMALRWSDRDINICKTISSSISTTCTGFVFAYVALYILLGKGVISFDPNNTLLTAIMGSVILSLLAVACTCILRKIWIVEDPLPMPGFQAELTLLDIAQKTRGGFINRAKKTIKHVALAAGLTAFFVFLRDFPAVKSKSLLSYLFKDSGHYENGSIIQIKDYQGIRKYIWTSFYLSPMMMAIGWFMKLKGTLYVCLGGILTWFVINPLAVHIKFSAYDLNVGKTIIITNPIVAYSNVGQIIAIGAILGSGITALFKVLPKVIKLCFFRNNEFSKGFKTLLSVVFISLFLLFLFSGRSFVSSFLVSLVLVVSCFFLEVVLIKILGETGGAPVGGIAFIVLLFSVLLLQALGLDVEETIIFSIICTTIFSTGIAVSGNMAWDFKTGLYVGNTVKNLTKAQIIGLIPGTLFAGIFATMLALRLEELGLLAPQANAFAIFIQGLLGFYIDWKLLVIGIIIGTCAEVITDRGTAFALGMYFPLGITLPLLFGGFLRCLWERKLQKIAPEEKSLRLISSYSVSTGLMVGESVMSVIVCLAYLILALSA